MRLPLIPEKESKDMLQDLEDTKDTIDSYILGETWTATLRSYVYQVEHLLAMI